MGDKTFTLDVNGYKYELPYWTYPWISRAVGDLEEGGVPLNLRATKGVDLWIKASDDVGFEFPDPRDPEIPQRLTQHQLHELMHIFDGDRDYGHRVLDLNCDDGQPLFWEWDDPNLR